MPTGIILGSAEQARRDLAPDAGARDQRRAHLSSAAALVSRLLHGRRGARPDHAAVGEARRVSRPGKDRREIVRAVRKSVAEHAGHPAIFGYLVGNEIPTTMVRWLGVRRVTEFRRDAHPCRSGS